MAEGVDGLLRDKTRLARVPRLADDVTDRIVALNRGKREFIQVLRLLEAMPLEVVSFAVTEAIRLGAIGFDAVKLIALARIERRPARLDLSAYPHLPKTTVRTTSAADYAVLLPEEAA